MANELEIEKRLSAIQVEVAKAQTNIEHAVTFKQLIFGILATIIGVALSVWGIIDQSKKGFERTLASKVDAAATTIATGASAKIASQVGEEALKVEQRLINLISENFSEIRKRFDQLPTDIQLNNGTPDIVNAMVKDFENISSQITAIESELRNLTAAVTVEAISDPGGDTEKSFAIYTWTGPDPSGLATTSNVSDTATSFRKLVEEGYISPTVVRPLDPHADWPIKP